MLNTAPGQVSTDPASHRYPDAPPDPPQSCRASAHTVGSAVFGLCTRKAGHPMPHEAGSPEVVSLAAPGGRVYVSWDDDRTTDGA